MKAVANIGLLWLGRTVSLLLSLTRIVFWGMRRPLASRGDTDAFLSAVKADMSEKSLGNGILLLLQDGEVVAEHMQSKGRPVTRETQFQMGSLSKWVTAFGVMTLVEKGRLDLDRPVSDYLTRWSLPDGQFDNDGVTVRHLLSHMAGLLDRLGYDGFAPDEKAQTIEQSLTQATDAMDHSPHGRVQVDIQPGTEFHYSGGGYTLLQLLIEEISGQSFSDYMQASIFEPLGMSSATFDKNALTHLADFYDEDGDIAPHYHYTALAAASLFASGDDMVRYLQAHLESVDGTPIGRSVLSEDTVREMRRPQSAMCRSGTLGQWGLGAILYAPSGEGDFLTGHIGGNRPASSTSAIIDPVSGDGIIIFTTGRPAYAIDLASEWVYWQSGYADSFMLKAEHEKGGWRAIMAKLYLSLLIFSYRLWWRRKQAAGNPQ